MLKSKFRVVVALLCCSLLCIQLQGCSCFSENSSSVSDTTPPTTTTAESVTTTTATKTTTTTSTQRTYPTKTTAPRSTTTGMPSDKLSDKVLSVPIIAQFPDFPTGCESVSAVMTLRYYGATISVNDFVDKHLPKSNHFWRRNGVLHGPDPNEYFIGDPASKNSFGCMAPVIEKALISYFGSAERVKNTTGESLSSLCTTYIDQGMPVLVWATIGMITTEGGDSWLLEDGSTFTWPKNEHCMVLIGYDNQRYYFNDPYRGTVKSYARALCESRYADLGMQSIAITK